MTKVTEKMREAAYKEMENFWGDDIDFEEGGKFDGFIVDMFNAMTAAQDEQEAIPENPRRNPYPQLVETADGFVHAADGDWELMTDSGRQILRKVEPQSVQVDREKFARYVQLSCAMDSLSIQNDAIWTDLHAEFESILSTESKPEISEAE